LQCAHEVRPGKRKRIVEVSRKLGRAYDFLVESRPESGNTPVVFRVREDNDKNHRTQNEVLPIEGNEVRQEES